jgi:hypothetical protein
MACNVPYLSETPPFGCFSDGICHLGTSGPKQHHLMRSDVHHVKESLHTHRGVALQQRTTNSQTQRPNMQNNLLSDSAEDSWLCQIRSSHSCEDDEGGFLGCEAAWAHRHRSFGERHFPPSASQPRKTKSSTLC